jgi:predicted nucleic acid-binding protein
MDGAPLSASQAWRVRDTILSDPQILMINEPDGFDAQWRRTSRSGKVGPSFWTDAYLVALCLFADYTLVTFDKALAEKRACKVDLLSGSGLKT